MADYGVRLPGVVRNSVRVRLVLLFFTITAGAVGFVYLYVVPQLRSSLTTERLQRLELVGAESVDRLERAALASRDPEQLGRLARRTAAASDARVTLLGVQGGEPAFVLADSESDPEAVQRDYRPAAGAAGSGSIRSGVAAVGGQRIGETAVPVPAQVDPVWVVVFSTPLGEVEDNVALISRQILIAGGIALTAALLAAWFAAGAHSRRLRRLEAAADEVAGGNFRVPIPIDSTDEVGQLARTFDSMQGRLAQLDSARREFIANASHELRTPVASLGGFLELLTEEDPDPASREEFLRTMRGQVDRLTKLTTDLLDLSKLDADALQLHSGPVDLAAVASDVVAEFTPQLTRSASVLRVVPQRGSKPLARGDLGRVMQIMRILIDNALKHTEEGTNISIDTSMSADSAMISVSDDGPGIAVANRDRIFDRFQTADPAGGTGLGLAISRELARRMGGELSLSSRRGQTRFTLSLPKMGEARS